MTSILAMALMAIAGGGQATTPQPAAPPSATPKTMQQSFDAATRAAEEGKCAEAVAGFTQIENSAQARRNELLRSTIAVRKGLCQVRLGQREEAETSIRRGIGFLDTRRSEFGPEVREAHLALARIASSQLDYATAIAEGETALAMSDGAARMAPLIVLAAVTRFDGDGVADRYATEAVDLVKAMPKPDKESVALIQTMRARVLLNQGKHTEAYAVLKDSLKKQGGLTTRVSISNIATRSDLALAALLNGQRDEARTYLAYTGAGRIADAPFTRSQSMEPPFCSEATGLKPSDYAVVQFTLLEDGSVDGVEPIYATGGREGALEFARAVATWSWTPETARAVPLFYRTLMRIELRCTKGGDTSAVLAPLATATNEWLNTKSPDPFALDQPEAKIVPVVRTALAQAKASGDRQGELRAALRLGMSSLEMLDARKAHLARAIELAVAERAPVQVVTYLAVRQQITAVESAGNARRLRTGFRSLLMQPQIAADPVSAATLKLLIASSEYRTALEPDAAALLAEVAEAPGLPQIHPLKTASLLMLANRAAASGDLASAARYFEQTGLTEQQCALIGVRPALQRTGTGSFPQEAQRMGFEGWVQVEFDIGSNGATARQRALISYPPFVFNDAATKLSTTMRYQKSYRPETGLACTANRQAVRFTLP